MNQDRVQNVVVGMKLAHDLANRLPGKHGYGDYLINPKAPAGQVTTYQGSPHKHQT